MLKKTEAACQRNFLENDTKTHEICQKKKLMVVVSSGFWLLEKAKKEIKKSKNKNLN